MQWYQKILLQSNYSRNYFTVNTYDFLAAYTLT